MVATDGLPDLLDQFKQLRTFLTNQPLAQQGAQPTDVGTEGGVIGVRRFGLCVHGVTPVDKVAVWTALSRPQSLKDRHLSHTR